jgi:transcriptional regulator with XRE-family HTH domain
MQFSEFQKATYEKLAAETGIAKSRWSLYFNNKVTLSEKTLSYAAAQLDMKPEELLQAINERRKRIAAKKVN